MDLYKDKLNTMDWIKIRLLFLILPSVFLTNLFFSPIENNSRIRLSYLDYVNDIEKNLETEDRYEIESFPPFDDKALDEGSDLSNLHPLYKIVSRYARYNIYAQNNVLLGIPSKNIENAGTLLRTDIDKRNHPDADNYVPDIGVGDVKRIYSRDIFLEEYEDLAASIEYSFILSDEAEWPDDGKVIVCEDKSYFSFFMKPTWYSRLIAFLVSMIGISFAIISPCGTLFRFIISASPFKESWLKFKKGGR